MLRRFQFGDQLSRSMKGFRVEMMFPKAVKIFAVFLPLWQLPLKICVTSEALSCPAAHFSGGWENKAKGKDRGAPLHCLVFLLMNYNYVCKNSRLEISCISRRNSRKTTWLPRHRKMNPFPPTASQEKSHVRNWSWKGHLAPLMRPTKFPKIPVSLERNTEVFRHPLL